MISLLPFALGFGALLILRGGSSGSPRTRIPLNINKLRYTTVAAAPTMWPNMPGAYLYGWRFAAVPTPGAPTALDQVRAEVKAGREVWADITFSGNDGFYLLSAPAGANIDRSLWTLLADATSAAELGLPQAGATFVPGSVPPNVPAGAIPINVPGDMPPLNFPTQTPPGFPQMPPGFPQMPPGFPQAPPGFPQVLPGPASASSEQPPAGSTGIPEVDNLLRSSDATPAQLRSVAAEMRRNGQAAGAAIVESRADALYRSLRAAHTAQGSTPYRVPLKGTTWPDMVAKHYGGTLKELQSVNPDRPWAQWEKGELWRLPLSWDAESKLPPVPRPDAAPKKIVKPAKTIVA